MGVGGGKRRFSPAFAKKKSEEDERGERHELKNIRRATWIRNS